MFFVASKKENSKMSLSGDFVKRPLCSEKSYILFYFLSRQRKPLNIMSGQVYTFHFDATIGDS